MLNSQNIKFICSFSIISIFMFFFGGIEKSLAGWTVVRNGAHLTSAWSCSSDSNIQCVGIKCVGRKPEDLYWFIDAPEPRYSPETTTAHWMVGHQAHRLEMTKAGPANNGMQHYEHQLKPEDAAFLQSIVQEETAAVKSEQFSRVFVDLNGASKAINQVFSQCNADWQTVVSNKSRRQVTGVSPKLANSNDLGDFVRLVFENNGCIASEEQIYRAIETRFGMVLANKTVIQTRSSNDVEVISRLPFTYRFSGSKFCQEVLTAKASSPVLASVGLEVRLAQFEDLIRVSQYGVENAGKMAASSGFLLNAANQGNAKAQNLYGYCLFMGSCGFPKNTEEALRYIQMSAAQGYAESQADLGYAFRFGLAGLAENKAQAAQLFRIAADKKNGAALYNLGNMIALGEGGLDKDDEKARELYEMAAMTGDAVVQFNVGAGYLFANPGFPQDTKEAVRFLTKSALKGHTHSQVALGLIYENGIGNVAKDEPAAARYYKDAADNGNIKGMTGYANCLQKGIGVPRDYNKSAQHYLSAFSKDSRRNVIEFFEESEKYLFRETRKEIQRELSKLGYRVGAIDGDFGPATKRALEAFLESHQVASSTEAKVAEFSSGGVIKSVKDAVRKELLPFCKKGAKLTWEDGSVEKGSVDQVVVFMEKIQCEWEFVNHPFCGARACEVRKYSVNNGKAILKSVTLR